MKTGGICMAVLALAVAAAGCVNSAVPVSPEDRQLLQSANNSLHAGDNAAAAESASRFIHAYPKNEESAEAYYLRGVARYRTNQVGPAREDFAEAIARTRRKDLTGLAHMELGAIAYKAGDSLSAGKHFRATLAVLPAGAPPADEAAFLLGCALQRQGKWPDADLCFDRVMKLFDGTDLAHLAAVRVHAVRWTVQAGAYDNPVPADDMLKRLRSAGLPATTGHELRGGRLMHLVQAGSYPTFNAAQAALPRVKAISKDALVVVAR